MKKIFVIGGAVAVIASAVAVVICKRKNSEV